MKKRNFKLSIILIFLTTLFGFNKLNGQSYLFNPGLVYTIYVDTSANNFGGIEIQNTSSQTLNLNWRLALTDTLIDSYFQLCNSGTCFLNLPASGQLPALLPGDIGWIKFHMFSGKTNGLNTIKYVLKNGALQKDTLTFNIYVVSGITAIKDLKNNINEITLFPNPTSNESSFHINLSKPSDLTINGFNSLGQCVFNTKNNYSVGLNTIVLNTENYTSGIYSFIIKTNSETFIKKLIIRK